MDESLVAMIIFVNDTQKVCLVVDNIFLNVLHDEKKMSYIYCNLYYDTNDQVLIYTFLLVLVFMLGKVILF